jgi:hypothetical protein
MNWGPQVVQLPRHDEVLIASTATHGAQLPADAAAWLR